MPGLPRHIIKKYGVSKKAWSVYRGGKSRKSRSTSRPKVRKSVSRRKYKMARKKTYSRKNTSFLGKLNRPVMGGLGVIAYESFLSPLLPFNGPAKDAIEMAVGMYLSKKKGILGATGQTLMTLNAYQLINGFAKPALSGMIGSVGSSVSTAYGGY